MITFMEWDCFQCWVNKHLPFKQCFQVWIMIYPKSKESFMDSFLITEGTTWSYFQTVCPHILSIIKSLKMSHTCQDPLFNEIYISSEIIQTHIDKYHRLSNLWKKTADVIEQSGMVLAKT